MLRAVFGGRVTVYTSVLPHHLAQGGGRCGPLPAACLPVRRPIVIYDDAPHTCITLTSLWGKFCGIPAELKRHVRCTFLQRLPVFIWATAMSTSRSRGPQVRGISAGGPCKPITQDRALDSSPSQQAAHHADQGLNEMNQFYHPKALAMACNGWSRAAGLIKKDAAARNGRTRGLRGWMAAARNHQPVGCHVKSNGRRSWIKSVSMFRRLCCISR